jgi:hypothetical protein
MVGVCSTATAGAAQSIYLTLHTLAFAYTNRVTYGMGINNGGKRVIKERGG